MFIKCHDLRGDEVYINPALVEFIQTDPEEPENNFPGGTRLTINDEQYFIKESPEYILTQSKLVSGLNIAGIGIQRVTVFTEPAQAPENNVTE